MALMTGQILKKKLLVNQKAQQKTIKNETRGEKKFTKMKKEVSLSYKATSRDIIYVLFEAQKECWGRKHI